MEVSVASTCSDVEMEAMNSEIESCDDESDPLLRQIKRNVEIDTVCCDTQALHIPCATSP